MSKARKRIKKRIFRYHLIFDTEALRQNETQEVLKELDGIMRAYSNCKLMYLIPEIVKEEYERYFYEEIIGKSRKALAILNKKLETRLGKEIKENMVKKAWDKEIDKFELLELPDEKHLKEIVKKTAWYKFPFGTGTKKFRDGLIVYQLSLEMDRLTRNANVAVISKDENLRNDLKKEFEGNEKVEVYDEVSSFESDFKLKLQEADEEFRDKIKKVAKIIFTRLAERERVEEKIKLEHADLFTKPRIEEFPYYGADISTIEERWQAVDEGRFGAKDPEFAEKIYKDRYIWESVVVYNQYFKKAPSITFVGGGGYEEIWRYTLEFRVKWSARVNEEGDFYEPKIEKIQFKNKESKPSYMAGYVTKYPEPAISTASGTVIEPLSSTPLKSEDILKDYLPQKKCQNCGIDFIPTLPRSLADEGLCDDCLRKKSGW